MATGPAPSIEPHKVELVLSQLESIPPLSPIVAKILSLTGDSKSSAGEVTQAISSDAGLTARILSILNQAQHGVRREAITVANAVKMLGFGAVRQMTLACKVMETFGSLEKRDADFDRGEFWKHSLAVGCAAERIAAALPGGPSPEEAFVCGLLHDLGKIALDTALPKSFARVVRETERVHGDIADIEREILGVDHCAAGRRLAERWKLPSRLTECIWLHHQLPEALPDSVAAGKHVQIVQLADVMVREQRIGYSGNHVQTSSSRELAARLGLAEDKRQAVLAAIGHQVAERAAWIGIAHLESEQIYVQALTKTAEELSLANVALASQNSQLARQAKYFHGMCVLNHAITPGASLREVAGACAAVLYNVLEVDGAIVFADELTGRWLEIGICDGQTSSTIERPGEGLSFSEQDKAASLEQALGGKWLSTPSESLKWLGDRYIARLGDGERWLLPIIRDRQWVAGALLGCSRAKAEALLGEAQEIEALSGALGLAIEQAKVQAEARAMTDELAEVNRRWSRIQSDLVRIKTADSVLAMAAGAAHEMNNPLAVISGRAQLLRDQLAKNEDREAVEIIAQQAQVCSDIITQLTEFSQPASLRPVTIQLGDFLTAFRTDLASRGLLATSAFDIEIEADMPAVSFDAQLLDRLFRELVQNTLQSADGSPPHLSIKASQNRAEKGVVIHVIDNGRGMPPEVLERATDPFFSSRPAGRGRGMGLTRVQHWLQVCGGTMRIRSELGHGTDIEIRLPTAKAEAGM